MYRIDLAFWTYAELCEMEKQCVVLERIMTLCVYSVLFS